MPEPSNVCANCGQELNSEGTAHYNGIVFCAFVTSQIDWDDWRTAKRIGDENDQS